MPPNWPGLNIPRNGCVCSMWASPAHANRCASPGTPAAARKPAWLCRWRPCLPYWRKRMLLPDSFTFTQQNLQDYKDCAYRFYLREILRLDWPAIESEPIREQEALMQLGSSFHLLCQQYFSGIPAEVLTAQISQPELAEWWQNFLKLGLHPAASEFSVEKLNSIPFEGFRLAAKVDLLRKLDGKLIIYDWKTSQHQPKRQSLLARMQSKVYPFVITQLPANKNLPPESIEMIYWYPAFQQSPVKFTYSSTQKDADQTELELLVAEITAKDKEAFRKTENLKSCSFCRYRSLCDRGKEAGLSDMEDDLPDSDDAFNFDFDAI
ncbi:PD-(D/E)XK nuclease family protein [bacterium]|nr:PD-(D/E)XK nuclease family protein [bacterium]